MDGAPGGDAGEAIGWWLWGWGRNTGVSPLRCAIQPRGFGRDDV